MGMGLPVVRAPQPGDGFQPLLRALRHSQITRAYWISCYKFTVRVETDGLRRITEAAPIVRRFVGQPVDNLIAWARKFGGLHVETLPDSAHGG